MFGPLIAIPIAQLPFVLRIGIPVGTGQQIHSAKAIRPVHNLTVNSARLRACPRSPGSPRLRSNGRSLSWPSRDCSTPGEGATDAIEWLKQRSQPQLIATIDPETFFDFQQERPKVRIAADGRRTIVWPTNDFYALPVGGEGGPSEHQRDLIVCAGVEPHLRWRSFCDSLLEVTQTMRADMVVTLGATVGANPHSRPFPVTGSAANPVLAKRLGLANPSYEGPTGVVGALHDVLDRANIPVISLRVAVPHYVPAPPNAKATRALLKRFEEVTRIHTGYTRLDRPATDWEGRVNDAAKDDAEVAAYVGKLEQTYDKAAPLPTGDDIAAELEAFLRERDPD